MKTSVRGTVRTAIQSSVKIAGSVGGDVVLPESGLVGVWYPDEYVSSPKPYIPNAVSPISPQSLVNGWRRLTGLFINAANATLTSEAATGPDGDQSAFTLVSSTTGWYASCVLANLAAGTYTFAVSVKRNTGSNQAFGLDTGGVSNFTATDTWQRFTRTFVHGGGSKAIYIVNNASQASLQVANWDVFAGSSDLGADSDVSGNMYLGWSKGGVTASATNGVLDMSANGAFGLVQFPEPLDLTDGFTAMFLARKTGASSGYPPLFAKLDRANSSAWTTFGTYQELGGRPFWVFAGNFAPGEVTSGSAWQQLNDGWHMYGFRYASSERSLWYDTAKIQAQVQAVTPPTLQDFYISNIGPGAEGRGWQYGPAAMWSRGLSDSEMATAATALLNRGGESSIELSPTRMVVADGDSLTADPGQYPDIYKGYDSPGCNLIVTARPGSVLTIDLGLPHSIEGRMASIRAKRPANPVAGSKYIWTCLITNGLTVKSAAEYLADLEELVAILKGDGWIVALGTLPPRASSDHNTKRAIINPVIRSWVGNQIDAVFDFAADPTIGPDAAALDTNLYSDTTHPTAQAQIDYFEPIYRAVVNAL